MKGPVVLVTGTSSGIGHACVRHLAAAGCQVVASARRPGAVADLEGPHVSTLRLDVTDDAERGHAIEETLRRHGRIDAVVNNAGWGAMLAAEDTAVATMRRMFETNVFGLHDLARRALPHMRAQGSGRIVNVASIAGHVAVPLMASYCATKFAVRALTLAMDSEVRRFGVRAILVEPGVIETGFGTHSLRETRASVDVEASPYRALYAKWAASRARRRGKHPDVIARLVAKAVTSRRPRNAYRAPFWDARAAAVAKAALPDAWVQAGMRRYFR